MCETLTDEFMYSCKRMKQKLLYQIGLTDDPWQDKDGFIMDNEYAVGQGDMAAIVQGQRSNSFDRFTGAGRRHDKEKTIRLPGGRIQTP